MNKVDARHRAAVNSLHPVFKWRVDKVLQALTSKGWRPVLVHGTRTEAQQRELVKRGTGVTKSWHVPSTRGLLFSNDGSQVHVVHGCAADIIDRRYAWTGPAADKNFQFWKDLGKAAKDNGLEWGGDWKKKDVAHVQMKIIEQRPRRSIVV